MSRLRIASLLAVLALVALTGCGRDQPLASQVGTQVYEVADRELLPPISGTTMDGAQLDLADHLGRVVVLNSWASWCGPCRDEVPALVDLAEAVDPDSVAVVGLNVSDDPEAAQRFVEEFSMPYPSIVDDSGALLPTIPGVPPAALPSTVVIDRDGRIAATVIGPVDGAELAGLVASVAAEGAAG